MKLPFRSNPAFPAASRSPPRLSIARLVFYFVYFCAIGLMRETTEEAKRIANGASSSN